MKHYWFHDKFWEMNIHSGNAAADVWWSDGTGESTEIGMSQDEWLITPEFDFSSYATINLTFWSIYFWNFDNSYFIKI